ncbi:putative gag-pol polyprotein, identical [Cucumis melo var. makuwa]|uniref:Gag-pol polyprotein, identical n=1 Tax=Cucumis melo var. makuwa TaxID=1194695 RepID=A0A5A7SM62_CUCMM|nr:putative gag-pol polyprotein, identical [Cucumis melo var. makuwa]
MGSNGNAMGTAQPLIPIFKGEGYEFWSIRMKTLLRSQDLWDLVEQGYADPDDEGTLRENRKKDSKALVIIQQAVHDSVFSRIAAATTSKQEWLILQKAFQGDSRVLVVQTYGETIKDQTIVEKVLRSLTLEFDHVVAAIEESKNLSTFTFIELMGSLEAHESRINRSMERNEEKAFQVDCRYKNQRVNFAAENEAFENNGKGENKLFMTNIPSDQKTAEVWFIDSSCLNHMTGLKPVFKELNEGEKLKVELGNGKELQVEGKGTVGIETHHGNRILTNVQYVPDIGYNLLSVGQLMESGYSILFDDGACLIKNKQTGRVLAKVKMTQSKMFPLEVSNVKSFALIATATNTTKNNSKLWYLRYGHLNIKGFSLLKQRDMVIGLPKISAINICEGCVYGKQTRKSFPIGKAWRASKCLELIHADLCGPM